MASNSSRKSEKSPGEPRTGPAEGSGSASPSRTRGTFLRILQWQPKPSTVARAAILGVFIAAGTWLVPDLGERLGIPGSSQESGGTSESPDSEQELSRDEEEAPAEPVALSPGTCAEAGKDSLVLSPVPCDTPHGLQVIPASYGCTADDASAYLGGDPDKDVLRSDLVVRDLGGACVLEIPGAIVETTFENALRLDDGPALRECHVRTTNRFVPCGDPHTGEVVHRAKDGSTETLDCEMRAEEYMDTSVDQVFKELRVSIPQGDPRRCVVELRDDTKYMSTGLRGIGVGSIRTEPIG